MDTYTTYLCISTCNGEEYNLRTNTDNECYKECPTGYYLSPNENKCYDNCMNSEHYTFTLKIIENGVEKKICSDSCNGLNYYPDNKICIDHCNGDDYVNIDTLECFTTCQDIGTSYYSYEKNSNPIAAYSVNSCVKICPEDKPYINGNICVSSCPNFLNGNECVNICPIDSYYVSNFLEDEQDRQKNA